MERPGGDGGGALRGGNISKRREGFIAETGLKWGRVTRMGENASGFNAGVTKPNGDYLRVKGLEGKRSILGGLGKYKGGPWRGVRGTAKHLVNM